MDGQEQVENEQEASMIMEIRKNMVQFNKDRLECEKNFQFIEAGRIKDHLKRLGEEYVRVSLGALRERQEAEKDGLEIEYEREVDELNAKWSEALQKNEEETKEDYLQMQDRQANEMTQEEDRLKHNTTRDIKMSPEVLNFEHQIQYLVKDQRYNEAAVVKRKLEASKDQCLQKNSFNINERIQMQLDSMSKRHQNELNALDKRMITKREALFKAKDQNLEAVNAKFRVFREKLENNHVTEFIREEKRLKSFNPCSNSMAFSE